MASFHNYPQQDLLRLLSSRNQIDRAEAARCLVNGKDKSCLPALLDLATDPSCLVRFQVPRAMVHLEARFQDVSDILDRLVVDPDELVRLMAQEAKATLGNREQGGGRPRIENTQGKE